MLEAGPWQRARNGAGAGAQGACGAWSPPRTGHRAAGEATAASRTRPRAMPRVPSPWSQEPGNQRRTDHSPAAPAPSSADRNGVSRLGL